jgi:hypothetical protein
METAPYSGTRGLRRLVSKSERAARRLLLT